MDNHVIVLADGACLPSKIPNQVKTLELFSYSRRQNVRIQLDALRTGLLTDVPERIDDLLRIASFVYSADTRIKRGTEKDVFGIYWKRNINLIVPVNDYDFWNTSVVDDLSDTLRYLTEDNWNFNFIRKDYQIPVQRFLFKDQLNYLPNVTTVIPFSGGVDSLAAVIDAISNGEKPFLVSHRASPIIDRRQSNLVDLLRNNFKDWPFPHISMWVNRKGGQRGVETTQRSRAFLYLSLAAAIAKIFNIDDIRLCDNGIISINLPQSNQAVGSYSTRSTHPQYIIKVQNLFRKILEQEKLTIKNTLLYKTKKEAMEIIRDSGYPSLLQETISCSHSEGMTRYQPHCGVCSQCIDRRFSSISAKMEKYDIAERYEKDIFYDNLIEGSERTYAENYIRFALKLEELTTPDLFFSEYPHLIDCLPDTVDAEEVAINFYELFQRHQKSVNRVIVDKIKKYATDLLKGSLPQYSLIKMVAEGKHLQDLKIEYIEKLKELFQASLPAAFQTQTAQNEKHVQDVAHSIIISSKENMDRESPQIPFAAVLTKPDFSRIESNAGSLFIEFKYIKNRRRLNSVQTEMTSRVTIYRDQGAWVLFAVYDPKRTIVDDNNFIQSFEKHSKIFISIIR